MLLSTSIVWKGQGNIDWTKLHKMETTFTHKKIILSSKEGRLRILPVRIQRRMHILLSSRNSQYKLTTFSTPSITLTQYVVVRRILQLWSRTIRKYRYKLHLWQQYLSFCVSLSSRKHFYKVLDEAISFMDNEPKLWLIGAAFEVEVVKSPWKARQFLLRGMKLVSKGLNHATLAKALIQVEIDFVKKIYAKQKMLNDQQVVVFPVQNDQSESEEDGQHIGGLSNNNIATKAEITKGEKQQLQNQLEKTLSLGTYDDVVFIIAEDALTVDSPFIGSQEVKRLLMEPINEAIPSMPNSLKPMLRKLAKRIERAEVEGRNGEKQQQQMELQIEDEAEFIKEQRERTSNISQALSQAFKVNCLRPNSMHDIIVECLEANQKQTLLWVVCQSAYRRHRLPLGTLYELLERQNRRTVGNEKEGHKLRAFIGMQIDRFIVPSDFHSHPALLEKVAAYNSQSGRAHKNATLMRAIGLHFKQQPHFIEECRKVIEI